MNVGRIAVIASIANFAAAIALTAHMAAAPIPLGTPFTYQGQLKDGSVPANGTYYLRFQLWNAVATGQQLGADLNFPAVTVSNGIFTVMLDFGAEVFNGSQRWLQIQVVTNGGATTTTLLPRQPITATPYALQTRGLFVNDAGAVGIGTTDPQADLYIDGANSTLASLQLHHPGASTGDLIFGSPAGSPGVLGMAPTNGHRRDIRFSDAGISLLTNTTSSAPGSTNGVFIDESGRTGIGTTSPNVRLHVTGGSDASPGGGGFIVVGDVASDNIALDSNEIMAQSAGAASNLYLNQNGGDVYMAAGSGGRVFIGTTTPTNAKVEVLTGDLFGLGVINDSPKTTLVVVNLGNGDAASFDGDVHIDGTLFKSSGAFRIDHPLDPANRYLNHSFVESPDMKNIYDGVVVTDGRGYATIQLPQWFEALNRDFRYQLTVIDGSETDDFILAKVVREIGGNTFTVRTSRPNVKVSWQVTGTRQDAWAEAHRIRVEEEKPEHERGTYLHPELYGLPRENRLDSGRD